MPTQITCNHKYVTTNFLNVGATNYQEMFFKCNGMFDPEDAIGGHQPLLFDQIGAFYNHYTVIGSRIKITINPTYALTTVNTGNCIVALTTNDNAVDASNVNLTLERLPRSSWKVVGYDGKPIVLTANFSMKKTFGTTLRDSLKGTPSADPSELSHFRLFAYNANGVNGVYLDYVVEISYLAQWHELKEITGS